MKILPLIVLLLMGGTALASEDTVDEPVAIPVWDDLTPDLQAFIAGWVHGVTTVVLWSDPPSSDEQMAILACVRQVTQEQMIFVLYTTGRWSTQNGLDLIPLAFEVCSEAIEEYIERTET